MDAALCTRRRPAVWDGDQGQGARTCFMLVAVAATPEAITAEEAAWAGIQLDFAAQLKPRVPDEHFKGANMKYGFFRRRLGPWAR